MARNLHTDIVYAHLHDYALPPELKIMIAQDASTVYCKGMILLESFLQLFCLSYCCVTLGENLNEYTL